MCVCVCVCHCVCVCVIVCVCVCVCVCVRVKRSLSKRIALKVDVLQDREIHCLQARPCICQPGNFTCWDSEGVNGKIFDVTEAKDHPTHSVRAQLHLPVLTAFGLQRLHSVNVQRYLKDKSKVRGDFLYDFH